MASWSNIQHLVDQMLEDVGTTRLNQGLWYGREAVRRAIQDFRETDTPTVYPLTAFDGTNDVDVDSGAVTLYGILVDNSQASTDAFVVLYNTATPTEGTTDPLGYLWAPRAAAHFYVFPSGITFDTAFTWSVVVGTEAGIEAGTLAAASVVSVGAVYTT